MAALGWKHVSGVVARDTPASTLRCTPSGQPPAPAPCRCRPPLQRQLQSPAVLSVRCCHLSWPTAGSLRYSALAAADTRAAVVACGPYLIANEHTALACAQEAEAVASEEAVCPEICGNLLSVSLGRAV